MDELRNSMRIKCRSRRGFSLLELMIALTILAIALVPVAYFYSKSLQMVEQSSVRTRALMLAQERLAELRQMPYDQIFSNVTPSPTQVRVYTAESAIDPTTADWFGYDYETAGDWQAMWHYPLPLDYNPYDPATQGYNNAVGVNRNTPSNPLGGVFSSHVNFNTPNSFDYEYEPIGFYNFRINRQNALLEAAGPGVDQIAVPDIADVRMIDRRSLPQVEQRLDNLNNMDNFRTGYGQLVEQYGEFGRRTIILDVVPNVGGENNPLDTDGDNFDPNDDRDGGATALDPYPIQKGPDNKFQVLTRGGGPGKLIIVQVFWLPRNPPDGYIPFSDLNVIDLRTFVSPTNEWTTLGEGSGPLTNNQSLIITPTN
ncbi:MAG: prepilin-type N-terminal cleavage/methylation domain-containing protein [bacterium]